MNLPDINNMIFSFHAIDRIRERISETMRLSELAWKFWEGWENALCCDRHTGQDFVVPLDIGGKLFIAQTYVPKDGSKTAVVVTVKRGCGRYRRAFKWDERKSA